MTKKILVVDDETYIREIVAFDLASLGCDILHADGGKAAFACVKAERPDVVLTDVRMPAGTGLDLLRWIKEHDAARPSVIMMTAFADVSADEALDLGAEAFLPKPVEKHDVLTEVAKALVPRPERWAVPVDAGVAVPLRPDDSDWLVGGRPPRIVLGSGGAFVEMDQDLPKSLEVVSFELRLSAAESDVLTGVGRVRWVRHEPGDGLLAGVGLEFLHLTDGSRERLMTVLGRGWPRAYVPFGRT